MAESSINQQIPIEPTEKKHWVDTLHSPLFAWVILITSIIVTFIAWYLSTSYANSRADERFEFQVEQAQFSIKKRMLEYEQMLRGGVGLFLTQPNVTRAMWHGYVANLQIEKYFPGIQGMGFSRWIQPRDRQSRIDKIRSEGFPDYTIRPEGVRDVYTAIEFLEPFEFRNKRAFGFDMYSESMRHQAMQRAIESGEAAVSGKVKLVQETENDVQAGFLMYLPVYAKPVSTIEERRSAIFGFVYSPFRIKDLMQGIHGVGLPEVKFSIYDGNTISEETLLFNSDVQDEIDTAQQSHQKQQTNALELGGHTWTIQYKSTPQFTQITSTSQPMIVAVGGVVIDLMLYFIILSLAKLRRRALRLAKTMLNELTKKELHFKAITDTANDGFILTDDTGNISYFNRAAEKIFGYSKEEALGKQITLLMSEKYRRNHNNAFHKFLETGKSKLIGKSLELEGLRKNGEVFPIELSFSHWVSDGVNHISAVARDITERKKVELMKNEFISTVSHELRTPLTALQGSVMLINSGLTGQLNQQGKELLTMATANIGRLGRLINDILDIEKIESGAVRFNIQQHSINALVSSAVSQQLPIAQQLGLAIDLQQNGDVNVLVDEDRFHQIMGNLLTNAIKFSTAGGHVKVNVEQSDAVVRVSITDHGPGINDEFKERIFQKFAQADGSDTKAKGGTGLGLSICKALVESFGGQIGYESTPNVTTTFFFDLPLRVSNNNAESAA